MRDQSVLWHRFSSSADFSHRANEAALQLKKLVLRGNTSRAEAHDLVEASTLVRQTVETVLRRLRGESMVAPASVPEGLLARIEADQHENIRRFMGELEKLDGALGRNAGLGTSDLDLLESICDAAEATAAATFGELNRR